MQDINWKRLSQAVPLYTALGYEYREVPWLVSSAADESTKPDNGASIVAWEESTDRYGHMVMRESGCLPASGEQSFVQLLFDGLKPGRYQCITPCFRVERRYTELTRPWFMKLELIEVAPAGIALGDVEEVANDALTVMRQFAAKDTITARSTGPNSLDLDVNGIEVGSYGARQYNRGEFQWIYGTGLAEPRFSEAMAHVAV